MEADFWKFIPIVTNLLEIRPSLRHNFESPLVESLTLTRRKKSVPTSFYVGRLV